MSSDAKLLNQYAHDRCEFAFAELVRGHIDLVYSSALRRLRGDPHLAAEATQQVFISLARHAGSLARHPVLNAWLHASTRNATANLLRRERRREFHQQKVHAMHELQSAERFAVEWDPVREDLDAALDALGDRDRQAIILRFFENRSYPDIGAALGLREEAARMRVDRALERLRARLQRKGVASTAAALAGAMSAHAVVAAPNGLASSVAVSASAAALGTTLPFFSLLSSMTLTKTSAVLAALALLAGVAATSYRLGAASAAASQSLSITASRLAASSHTAPTATIDSFSAKITLPPFASANSSADTDQKITALRDMFARLPEQSVPELVFVTDGEWHMAVDGKLDTPEDFRRAMARVRSFAQDHFAKALYPAILEYRKANGGKFITDTAQLQPYLAAEITPEMLQRYELVPDGAVRSVRMGGQSALTAPLIDSEYDTHVVIGPMGWGTASSTQTAAMRDVNVIMPAIRAYRADHPEGYSEMLTLLPYATTPEQRTIIEKLAKTHDILR